MVTAYSLPQPIATQSICGDEWLANGAISRNSPSPAIGFFNHAKANLYQTTHVH